MTLLDSRAKLRNADGSLSRSHDGSRRPLREFVFTKHGDGWLEKPLSKLCDIKHGFAFKSEFFTDSGDYTLLTPGNLYETGGYRDRDEKQKYYSGEIPDGFILSEGDLL